MPILTGAVEMAPINAPNVVHQWLQSVKSRLAPDFLNAKEMVEIDLHSIYLYIIICLSKLLEF